MDLERRRVQDALETTVRTGDVTIDWLDPPTPQALFRALQTGTYHVLHFIGVGTMAENGSRDSGGAIYLENNDRSPAPVSSSTLALLLRDHDSMQFVMLDSSEATLTTSIDAFASVATSIVRRGVPAVVVTQFEMSQGAGIVFTSELYRSLVTRREPIDVAVTEGRKAVFIERSETEWAAPVLFLSNLDGRLIPTSRDGSEAAHGSPDGA